MNAQQTAAVAQLRGLDLSAYAGKFLPNVISDAWFPDTMRGMIESAGIPVASAAPRKGCSMLVTTASGFAIAYNGYVYRPGDETQRQEWNPSA